MLEVTISDEDLLPTIVKGVGCLYAAGCTKGTETGLAGAADMILPAAAIKLKGITAGAWDGSEVGASAEVGLLLDPQPMPSTPDHQSLSEKVSNSRDVGQSSSIRW